MASHTGLSECCISGKLHSGAPVGRTEKIGELDTYVTGTNTAKTIIFITDIFGYELPNVRLLADNFAAANFRVLIPDLLNGDPLPKDFLDSVEPPLKTRQQLSLVEKGTKSATVATTLPPWLVKHREGVTKPMLEQFVKDVRKQAGVQKVGTLGFCWGGRYSILLAGTDLVEAAAANHPSLLSIPADFEGIKHPLCIAVGDSDSLLDVDQINKIKEAMKEKSTPFECKVYKDQVHGFTLRGDHSSEADAKAMDEAEKQIIGWFEKYLA